MTLSPDEVTLISTLAPTLVAAVVTWVASEAVSLMRDKFHMTISNAQARTVHDAVNTAAGVVMSQLSRGVLTPADLHAGHPAVIAAAAAARQAVPDAADAMNVTVEDMVRMVVGRLGHEANYLPAPSTTTTVVSPTPAPKDAPSHA